MPDFRAVPPPVSTTAYQLLAPVPIACFVGALLTDIAYWATAQMMWADFSAWLLAAGLLIGLIVVILALIAIFSHAPLRRSRLAWIHGVGYLVALILSLLNMFIHSRDAWTSVVPTGITLSILAVLIFIATSVVGIAELRRVRVVR
jgi:uncharacterized membrane protein